MLVFALGSGFFTGFFFCVKMLTGGFFLITCGPLGVGVAEDAADAGFGGEALMTELCGRLCSR